MVDVVLTTDGHFVGQNAGEVGYNAFIGRPSGQPGPGMDRSREVWQTFSDVERAAVRYRADNPPDGEPIPLELFGIEPEPEPRIMCYFPKGYGPKGKA